MPMSRTYRLIKSARAPASATYPATVQDPSPITEDDASTLAILVTRGRQVAPRSRLRARTVARDVALLRDHVRPSLGTGPSSSVHRCLHRALAQAVTWRLVAHNHATHATPPPRPHPTAVALAPEQVAVLLDAADHHPSPWLGPWTVLAAATGARNGELCGLEWADLDLDAGTVRFRQALTIVDPAVLPDAGAPTTAKVTATLVTSA